MRYKEFKLDEASGIFNRKAGQMFKHSQTNHELEFIKAISFPDGPVELDGKTWTGQFPNEEMRDEAVQKVNETADKGIQWTNNPTSGTLAFGLAYLLDRQDSFYIDAPDGSKPEYTHIFGRYFQQMKQVGLPANWNSKYMMGYNVQIGAATKLKAGLQPQDLIGIEENRYKGIASLMKVVRNNLKTKPQILSGFEQMAKGTMPAVFEGQRDLATAIRDFAGEVLQPLAIMSGANVGQGIPAAKADLLPNTDWSDLDLYWPSDKNHNLVDSIFVREDGLEIGISSKGKQGADASMKNIMDAINKAKLAGSKLLDSYPDVVDISNIVNEESSEAGPPILAVKLGLINEDTKEQIMKLPFGPDGTSPKNQTKIDVDTLKALNNDQIMGVYKSFGARLTHPNYNIYYHMISNCAKMVAEKLNADPKFGQGMMEFMKQASIVQVYTNISQKGDNVEVDNFRSVYPPQFSGVITVNGGKNYAATKIFGKLAFKMP